MIRLREKVEKIKIGELFKKLEIAEKENSAKEIPFQLQVKTPYGFKKIKTAFRTAKQKTVTTYFGNNKTLKTSNKHRLRSSGSWIYVKNIKINDSVDTEFGITYVKRKHVGKSEILYDISVEDVHCYYSNGIVSHNSWLLCKIGAEAIRQGKTVVHYTMELNESYVGLRYDAIFTGIGFQELKNNKDQVKEKVKLYKNKLIIKYFPLKTVSAQSIKLHTDRIQTLGTKVDLLIVDYGDLLKPVTQVKNANSYNESGGIYEELRGIAGELQLPLWSASQSHRESADEDIIQGHNIAESYKKVMTGDFIMSLSRKIADKAKNTARIHIIKNRYGQDGLTLPSRFNSSNGDIQIFEEKSKEGIALTSEMKAGGDTIKRILSNKWNESKPNKPKESTSDDPEAPPTDSDGKFSGFG